MWVRECVQGERACKRKGERKRELCVCEREMEKVCEG